MEEPSCTRPSWDLTPALSALAAYGSRFGLGLLLDPAILDKDKRMAVDCPFAHNCDLDEAIPTGRFDDLRVKAVFKLHKMATSLGARSESRFIVSVPCPVHTV